MADSLLHLKVPGHFVPYMLADDPYQGHSVARYYILDSFKCGGRLPPPASKCQDAIAVWTANVSFWID